MCERDEYEILSLLQFINNADKLRMYWMQFENDCDGQRESSQY